MLWRDLLCRIACSDADANHDMLSQAASSASMQPERKADARPVHVKLLDVSEVKKLSRQHAPASSDHSNAVANGHAQ